MTSCIIATLLLWHPHWWRNTTFSLTSPRLLIIQTISRTISSSLWAKPGNLNDHFSFSNDVVSVSWSCILIKTVCVWLSKPPAPGTDYGYRSPQLLRCSSSRSPSMCSETPTAGLGHGVASIRWAAKTRPLRGHSWNPANLGPESDSHGFLTVQKLPTYSTEADSGVEVDPPLNQWRSAYVRESKNMLLPPLSWFWCLLAATKQTQTPLSVWITKKEQQLNEDVFQH